LCNLKMICASSNLQIVPPPSKSLELGTLSKGSLPPDLYFSSSLSLSFDVSVENSVPLSAPSGGLEPA
jgi:hypothetical protein